MMLRLVYCLAGLLAIQPAIADKEIKLDFTSVTISSVIEMVYAESKINRSYVLDPSLLSDSRKVTFRHASNSAGTRRFLSALLDSLGYSIATRDGIDFITKTDSRPASQTLIYTPRFRDAGYLSRTLESVFPKGFGDIRQIRSASPEVSVEPPKNSAAALIDQAADVLVFNGSLSDIEHLKSLLALTDTPQGDVLVSGLVYEVSTSQKEGSAIQLAMRALNGSLSLALGSTLPLENSIRLNTGSFDLLADALSADAHFKVISQPTLRIRSGSAGRFSVGQEVPVLGALSFPQGSNQAVQSIEYRSSGVLFDVRPQVRDEAIDLRINQQLSNFARTETGVNGSPTLTKRAVETSTSVQDGETILLSGLSETKDADSSSWLPFSKLLGAHSSDISRSEILLVLHVQRLNQLHPASSRTSTKHCSEASC